MNPTPSTGVHLASRSISVLITFVLTSFSSSSKTIAGPHEPDRWDGATHRWIIEKAVEALSVEERHALDQLGIMEHAIDVCRNMDRGGADQRHHSFRLDDPLVAQFQGNYRGVDSAPNKDEIIHSAGRLPWLVRTEHDSLVARLDLEPYETAEIARSLGRVLHLVADATQPFHSTGQSTCPHPRAGNLHDRFEEDSARLITDGRISVESLPELALIDDPFAFVVDLVTSSHGFVEAVLASDNNCWISNEHQHARFRDEILPVVADRVRSAVWACASVIRSVLRSARLPTDRSLVLLLPEFPDETSNLQRTGDAGQDEPSARDRGLLPVFLAAIAGAAAVLLLMALRRGTQLKDHV